MKLVDLIRRFRVLANDRAAPYFWDDDDVRDWLNDAQAQAAVRGRLLRDDGTTEVTRIALQAGVSAYPLHVSVYELISLRIKPSVGAGRPLLLKTREWLDAERPGWRDDDRPAGYVIQDDTRLRIVGTLAAGDVLELDAYRLPLAELEGDDDVPEIHQAHHEHLIQWALHKAFSVPDSESFDPQRSALAHLAFTTYFGPMPDSDLRRSTRHDVVHFNRSPLQ